MDVDVALFEDLNVDPEPFGAAAHHGAGRFDRLLHDIAQRAGADHAALAGHRHRFDRQQIAADLGPCKSDNLPNLILFCSHAIIVTTHTEEFVDIFGCDIDLSLLLFEQQHLHYLAANL